VFILLEFPSPSRRIFISSHSLPPSLVRRISPSPVCQVCGPAVWPVDESAGRCRCYNQAGGWSRQRFLSRVVLGLRLVRVRSEVQLVGGVQVVVGDGVGVRVVLRGDLLPSPARGKSFRVGLASDAEAVWEVLMKWGVRTRWLYSQLACDASQGGRV
jgi:hypothetical protein